MGLFDRFRRQPTPSPQPRRLATRRYDGAAGGRLFADWRAGSNSADTEIQNSLTTLRDRSRDLARNDQYFRRYLSLMQTNVVGERGVNLQVKALNDDGSLDSFANDLIEREWSDWCKAGSCTSDGRLNFSDVQRLFVQSLLRDGEVLVRYQVGENKSKFALEFIDPDFLDENYTKELQNGNVVRMGVELAKRTRRPVAYYLLQKHPGDVNFATIPKDYQVVKVRDMLHIYVQDRPGQTRGVPSNTSIMTALRHLHSHREAELIAARVGASKIGFFTSRTGDEFPADELDGLEMPLIDAQPGTFHQLPSGVDFTTFDVDHPSTAFADFERSVLRSIASGLNISYNSLANDLTSVNYSSIRAGTLEDREAYKVQQRFMIAHLVEPVYQTWLARLFDSPDFPLPASRLPKFANASFFRPKGFQWVDPMKEIGAAVIGLQNGIMSLQDVASNYGRDVEETMSQIARDKDIAEQYGITLAFEPLGSAHAPITPLGVEEDEDDS